MMSISLSGEQYSMPLPGMGGAPPPGGERYPSGVDMGMMHVTAGQYRQIEMQQDEVLNRASQVQGLLNYLSFLDTASFDRCLGRSGKSVECLSRAPDGGPTPRMFATQSSRVSPRGKGGREEAVRHANLAATRKELAGLGTEEVLERLQQAFKLYADPMLYAHTGRREMSIVGFLRLLRDCRLLDNKLTIVQADAIFTRADAGTDGSDGTRPEPEDATIDFEEFVRCLRGVVRYKYPTASASNPQEAVLLLARRWLLPFARDSTMAPSGAGTNTVNALFSRGTVNLLRRLDPHLKKLFAWYSSIEETDPAKVTWGWVRDHGGTMSSCQFVLALLNFSVLPVLISKNAALDVFSQCEAAHDGDEKNNNMFFPAFLEALAEVALAVGEGSVPRLRTTSSPDELKLLRRYGEACPPPHGPLVQQAYQEVLASRGRDALTLDQHAPYDAEGVRRRNEKLAEAAKRRTEDKMTKGVVERRETMRQRFALTRLRNFYRDVRTTNNNTLWPPERDVSPTHRSGALAGGPSTGGVGLGSDGEAEGVHVAFFDSERAIKTPRAVWIPHAISRRYSFFGGGHGGGTNDGMAPSPSAPGPPNMLVLETPTGASAAVAAGMHRASHMGAAPRPLGHNAGPLASPAAFVRSPKPATYKMAMRIEDRDEHEAILDLAARLPALKRTPSSSAQTKLRADEGGAEASSTARDWYEANKPRATTAPADLHRPRRESHGVHDALAPSASHSHSHPRPHHQLNPLDSTAENEARAGAGAGGLAHAGGGGDAGGAGVGGIVEGLPPMGRMGYPLVRRQLPRVQANAAAMAALAGQDLPPHPFSAVLAAPVATTSGSGPLGPLGPTGPGLAGIVPLGPSPSQLSSLGLVPQASTAASSMRLSQASSTTRRAAVRQRKRVDPMALPTLALPADAGPGREEVEALQDLERFVW
ncbi:hypothetical protein HYH03_003033 [Edaphochlamys debaryana]|uniref:Uncharacterized protein n=1 Tax=Edaphochlamys debaryana TaxID=47281 RepID=A0A835YA55_9CHLO|nr:hypothetical protein HYH03_003033 [Edaphochlamys debaryana]|eukprot:KAG2498841.1 hypothetical protein HYH03_003033 [Edaphochlamys debaryana]